MRLFVKVSRDLLFFYFYIAFDGEELTDLK